MGMTRMMPWLTGILLFAVAGLLFVRTASEQMALYIHPRYEVLMYGCGAVLFALAIICITMPIPIPRHSIQFLLIPVLFGLGIAPRALGADAIGHQSTALNQIAQRPQSAVANVSAVDTRQWNIYEWAVAASIDPLALKGKPVQIDGFVVRNSAMQLADNQFMLARYVITCCVADAGGVGMHVQWANSASYHSDQWVHVEGVIDMQNVNGVMQPLVIAHTVAQITAPPKPYLVLQK
jgi:uncharacterized repeat protein (TIGR03943 family)